MSTKRSNTILHKRKYRAQVYMYKDTYCIFPRSDCFIQRTKTQLTIFDLCSETTNIESVTKSGLWSSQ